MTALTFAPIRSGQRIFNRLIHRLEVLLARRALPKAQISPAGTALSDAGPWHKLAREQLEARDIRGALASLQHITDVKNDDVAAWLKQAELCLQLDRGDDAADAFDMALLHEPESVSALIGLARLRGDNAPEQSIDYLRRALQVQPLNPVLHFEYALNHNRNGDTLTAEASYHRAIELDPAYTAALVNLGLLYLVQMGDASRAQAFLERAVELEPEMVAAQANLGLALQEQGKFDAAYAHYENLINSHADSVEYRWNRALARLSQGEFGRAWDDYELRNVRAGGSGRRQFPFMEWDGDAVDAHHLLIYGEQGLGDEIMFASCLPDILNNAHNTVIECNPRLEALFRRSFPRAVVHGGARDGDRSWLRRFPHLDRQIPIASLPRFVRRHRADFPVHNGYLIADPERVRYWQSRLAACGGRLRIGISWRGGTRKTRAEARSMPLAECMPLFFQSGCEFICLQDAQHEGELAALHQVRDRVHQWPEAVQSIDELAAVIAALDLVIAVPSTVVHLAGALGKDVWVLLSANPEWRYLWNGNRMPWYPSARLFRQQASRDWSGVMTNVVQNLKTTCERNAQR